MQSWAERSPYCIALNVCLATFASFDHSVLHFPTLCKESINWHFTRVTPSGKSCQCSPLLVSALSIHPFSSTVLRVLEPIPTLLTRTRSQPLALSFHTCRQSGFLAREPEENPLNHWECKNLHIHPGASSSALGC